MMIKLLMALSFVAFIVSCDPKLANGLRKHDLNKDIEVITNRGSLIIRLSDSTPLHRDNFLLLVRKGYYDSILFHRVIRHFMIQAGDPMSRNAPSADSSGGMPTLGDGGPPYTIPAEFRATLFHQRGALGAAREGDDVNPQKASSGSQFYIVQGKTFTDGGLDSVEQRRLKGRKIPAERRAIYKTIGGSPHLDGNYTVFGQVVRGMGVVDSIAAAATDRADRPLKDVRILTMKLVKRRNYTN